MKDKNKKYKKKQIEYHPIEYDYHLPVLLKESIDLLVTDPKGVYIDGTLGGGGHTFEILTRLDDDGLLIAFDKDTESIKHNQNKYKTELESSKSKLIIRQDSYEEACSIEEYWGKIKGFFLDLGLSSRQLDESCRGFSYRANSRLDMRFGNSEISAEDLLHASKEDELRKIFRLYGEEPFANSIARRIIERRRATPLYSTFDLKEIIENSVPFNQRSKSLSRVFQAIRIAVNDELNTLQRTLDKLINILAPNARIVIISYHSLEDRIVKNFFKEHSIPKNKFKECDEVIASTVPQLRIITPKPIIPVESEIEINPRARSAKMRAAVRE